MTARTIQSNLSALTFRGLKANAKVYRYLSLPVISTGRSFAYYQKVFFGSRHQREILEALDGKRVLDVGCGLTPYVSDSMFQVCRKNNIEFYGADPKFDDGFRPGMLDVAGIRAVGGRGKILPRAPGLEKYVRAYADDLPFEDESVDLILSNFLLYAWITDESALERTYREFHRILRRGGEVRVYPAPDLDMDHIRDVGLREVMDRFEIRLRFLTGWLNPGKYPPAYVMTMKK